MNHNSVAIHLLNPKVKNKGTYFYIIIIVISIVTYIADIILDVILALNHYNDGNVWFFVQTVCSVVIPALILTVFNIWWYKADASIKKTSADTDADIAETHYVDPCKVSRKLWIMRIFFIILLMAPLLRYFEALYCAIRSIKSRDEKEKEIYNLRMNSFITDAAILTVFDAFMEGGPQVVLQTCIFSQKQASNPNIFTITEIWQLATIVVALFSMSAAYAAYQRALRSSLDDRRKLNIPTMMFLIVWRYLDIASRVIALGLFASVFPYYLILTCCVHFIAMFAWIRSMETNFCDNNKIREFVYNLVLGEIFVFFYFNPKDEPTQKRYTIYYILIFCENTALILVWYYYYSPGVHFRFPALILQFSSFVVAILLMVIYYYFLHPTRGKMSQKSKTEEKSSETEMKHYEPNVNADENENKKLNTKETTTS